MELGPTLDARPKLRGDGDLANPVVVVKMKVGRRRIKGCFRHGASFANRSGPVLEKCVRGDDIAFAPNGMLFG